MLRQASKQSVKRESRGVLFEFAARSNNGMRPQLQKVLEAMLLDLRIKRLARDLEQLGRLAFIAARAFQGATD